MGKKKLMIIGWDAADWTLIAPLLADGKMPALKRLIDKGVHGNLATMNPPYSPMLWTSVATGKTADKHGVLGFLELDANSQVVRPVTVKQRKVRALWNILHNQGMRSNLVGWWPSFPAEPINGCIVSDLFPKPVGGMDEEWPMPEGIVFPKELADEISDLRVHPYELTEAHVLPFLPLLQEYEDKKDKGIITLMKILAHNVSIQAASTYLMRTRDWDFMGVYFDLIDHLCHAFIKFHPPQLPGMPDTLYNMYKDVVKGGYMFQDMMLERCMELADDDTVIIVMSDHGFESGVARNIKKPTDFQAPPAMDHREFGMFVAAGPGIKKGEKLFGLSLLDIAPTVLHYFGLPVGRDMDGSVIMDAFAQKKEVEFIDSWENVAGDFGLHKDHSPADPLSQQEAMEQLIDLGYIDRPTENMEIALHKTKCDLKYNLARVFMGKKETQKAEVILEELTLEKDINKVPIYLDLINIQILKSDYEKGRLYIDALKEIDTQQIVRIKIIEAKILLGEGKIRKAEKLLREIKPEEDNTGATQYELGRLLMRLEKYQEARELFEQSVSKKPDNAKYHASLANCLMRLDLPEHAADHALISIEMMRYFPDAHYVMGEALERLGDKTNALKAYEMARKLSPKMKRASMAIKNIIDTENISPESLTIEPENFLGEVIVVSGLPRSGTSMMMQMLESGGLPVLTDSLRTADDNNPKGYFELEKIKGLHKDNSWFHEANGKVIKVIAQLLKFMPVGYKYKVIFMQRDISEVIKSQQIMLNRQDKIPILGVREAFLNELKKVDVWQKREPGVEMLYLNYADVVHDPGKAVEAIQNFLGRPLEKAHMISSVEKNLYRNKRS